jgi:hypothetical protein
MKKKIFRARLIEESQYTLEIEADYEERSNNKNE